MMEENMNKVLKKKYKTSLAKKVLVYLIKKFENMARTKTTKKKSNCKTALYKFCKKQTEKKYKMLNLIEKRTELEETYIDTHLKGLTKKHFYIQLL